MKMTNIDLHASLQRMMSKGSPLNTVIEEQKPKKAPKPKTKRKSRTPKPEPFKRQTHKPVVTYNEADVELLDNFVFIFNHRPYEAINRHNTVTLTDLTTYQSSITPSLWEEEEIQHLHDYLQRNWETLEVHLTDTDDMESTTFLMDALFDIVAQ